VQAAEMGCAVMSQTLFSATADTYNAAADYSGEHTTTMTLLKNVAYGNDATSRGTSLLNANNKS
jgi:hypothetical protein